MVSGLNLEEIKQYIKSDLDSLRGIYDQEFGKLAVGRLLLNSTLSAMEEENEKVKVRYGSMVIENRLDKDFLKKYGITPINHFKEMFKLLEAQVKDEFEFRRNVIRQYIKDNGLEFHTEEIIEGIDKTAKRVTIYSESSVTESGNPLKCRIVLEQDMSELLEFGLDYVDRWKRYNELFNQLQL